MSRFSYIEQNDEFELWHENQPYKFYSCSDDIHIVNTKTGENCGTRVILYINADGTLDEDCYEYVNNNEE